VMGHFENHACSDHEWLRLLFTRQQKGRVKSGWVRTSSTKAMRTLLGILAAMRREALNIRASSTVAYKTGSNFRSFLLSTQHQSCICCSSFNGSSRLRGVI
jgi:hypothetical protein